MARKTTTEEEAAPGVALRDRILAARRWVRRWILRIVAGIVVLMLLLIAANSLLRPLPGFYMESEKARLGKVSQTWVPLSKIAPVMARSAVAAEDANFCEHWGFDMSAIRDAIADGMARGGSTIDQQVVKNVYLWPGRNYVRKALEGVLTPPVELFWSKRRILEVYLNVAEFDEGVFGVQAAARHYFGVDADKLSPRQAALLAAILPAPKDWSPLHPSAHVRHRAVQIEDGAATIRRDGRASCFEQ